MFSFLGPYQLLIAGALMIAALGTSYLRGRADGANAVEAHIAEQQTVVNETRAAAIAGAAEEIAKIQIRHNTIKQELEKQIVEKPVYRDCVVDERGMQLINSALTAGASAVPVGNGNVSGADTAVGAEHGGNR